MCRLCSCKNFWLGDLMGLMHRRIFHFHLIQKLVHLIEVSCLFSKQGRVFFPLFFQSIKCICIVRQQSLFTCSLSSWVLRCSLSESREKYNHHTWRSECNIKLSVNRFVQVVAIVAISSNFVNQLHYHRDKAV